MTASDLKWFNYYSAAPKSHGRTEVAVVHAELWPIGTEKPVSTDITDLVKRVYATKSAVNTMEIVTQFTEDMDRASFSTQTLTVSALLLDHMGKIAVAEEFSYSPSARVHGIKEIVGSPICNQIQLNYDLINEIRNKAAAAPGEGAEE